MTLAQLDLGLVKFTIKSEDSSVSRILAQLFGTSSRSCQPLGKPKAREHHYRITQDIAGGYEINVDDGGRQASLGHEWAVHITVSLMSDQLTTAFTQRFRTFHAAAFAKGSTGVLVPGASHEGKSTTSAIFALAGFRHYTDDVAVLDDNLQLLPFPRAIMLRNGGWHRLVQTFPDIAERYLIWGNEVTQSWYVRPPNVGSPDGTEPPAINLILLPTRDPAAPTIARLSRADVIPVMINQCFGMSGAPQDSLEVIVRLVSHSECYRINMARPREAVEAVNGLIDG